MIKLLKEKRPLALVVDDDFNIRLLVRKALEEIDCTVEEAANGREALDMFERLKPDIILLEVKMPEMNGFEVCSSIRKLYYGSYVPIVMITSVTDKDLISRAYELGATDFITKPINWILLSQRIRFILRTNRRAPFLKGSRLINKKNDIFSKSKGEVKPTALVVDDDDNIRLLIREVLEQENFIVKEAVNGFEGLDTFESLEPDIMLLDVKMPKINGFDVCRNIRSKLNYSYIPIIMVTGVNDLTSIRLAYEIGATDFITKPINWMIFSHRIRYILRSSWAIQRLRINEALLSNVQHITHIGSWELDIKKDKMFWSKETFNIYGLEPEETENIYEKFLSLIHPDDKENLSKLMNQAIHHGKSFNVDHRINILNKFERFVSQKVEVILDDLSIPIQLIGTVQDITQRKTTEEELKIAKKKADDSNLAKSRFLANISHEFRTPLNGIIGITDLLFDTNIDSEQKEYLDSIRESADHLVVLINDILDFSKIEAGKIELNNIKFNLRESVLDTLKMLAIKAYEKEIDLSYYIFPDIPNALIGDPSRLRQIVTNIVGNAIKFTKNGEVKLRVEIKEETEDNVCLYFIVSDTGIGIPLHKQQMIFEPFEQVETNLNRSYEGTGLGLSISKRLVNELKGQIWVKSTLGKGSEFHFTTCFSIQKVSEKEVLPEKTSINLTSLSILVVDDSKTNRKTLNRTLTNWNMKPTIVSSGEEALIELNKAEASGKLFEIAIIDTRMPDMNGYELISHIKERYRLMTPKIILLSSVGKRGDAQICENLGISAYLPKPVYPSDLFDTIQMLMRFKLAKKEQSQLITRHLLREKSKLLKILLSEDNPINQKLMVRILKKWGHAVVTANNGKEALRILEKQQFDLVFMDVQMPEMNGIEATILIREKEKKTGLHIPIVAMTAHATQVYCQKCLNAGMDKYITKPIQSNKILEIINSVSSETFKSETFKIIEEKAEEKPKKMIFNHEEALKRVEGDLKFLKELINLFYDNTPKMLTKLKKALNDKDGETIEKVVHTLKGSASYLSADIICETAYQLEIAGKNQNFTKAYLLYEEVEQEFEKFKKIEL